MDQRVTIVEQRFRSGGIVRHVSGSVMSVSVVAPNLSFMPSGGYGHRGTVKLLRRTALATRPGDALDVRLQGKRRFIVTVDRTDDFVTALGPTVAS